MVRHRNLLLASEHFKRELESKILDACMAKEELNYLEDEEESLDKDRWFPR